MPPYFRDPNAPDDDQAGSYFLSRPDPWPGNVYFRGNGAWPGQLPPEFRAPDALPGVLFTGSRPDGMAPTPAADRFERLLQALARTDGSLMVDQRPASPFDPRSVMLAFGPAGPIGDDPSGAASSADRQQTLQGMVGAPDVPTFGMTQQLPGAYDQSELARVLAATGNPPTPFAGDDPAGGFVGADQYQHGYTSAKPGWHHYSAGPNLACPADWGCTAADLSEPYARSSVPGVGSTTPQSGGTYDVSDPIFGQRGGPVRTEISPDGMTITNTTLPGHELFDGQVIRRLRQAPDGSWYVTTTGFGNNQAPEEQLPKGEFRTQPNNGFWDRMNNEFRSRVNAIGGPAIFTKQDEQLLEEMRRRYGR